MSSGPAVSARTASYAELSCESRRDADARTHRADTLDALTTVIDGAACDTRSEEAADDTRGLMRDVLALAEAERRYAAALLSTAETDERNLRTLESEADDKTPSKDVLARLDAGSAEAAAALPTMAERNQMSLRWQEILSRAEALDIDTSGL